MKTILLAGELGALYGQKWTLDVRTPAEAIRAIEANRPGFMAHIARSGERGVGYQVLLDDRNLALTDIGDPCGRETLHIVPVIGGAGKSGITGILIGAAMIAAVVYTGGIGAAGYFGTSMGTLGGMTVGSVMQSIGVSLILGGVTQMLVGTPKAPDPSTAPAARNSYNFNGPENRIGQGGAVPVGYGRALVGSQRISVGIVAEDVLA